MSETVKQRSRYDCVPAVAAMITGFPQESFELFIKDIVQSLMPAPSNPYFKGMVAYPEKGYTLQDLKLYLLALGYNVGFFTEIAPAVPVEDVLPSVSLQPIKLEVDLKGKHSILVDCVNNHLAYWDGHEVHDPAREARPFLLTLIISVHKRDY